MLTWMHGRAGRHSIGFLACFAGSVAVGVLCDAIHLGSPITLTATAVCMLAGMIFERHNWLAR